MARISHQSESNKSSNPTTQFLEWKSTNKSFNFYDKGTSKNVTVSLPMKFVFLQQYHTVKGWNDASESRIYSNEVFYIGSERMTVKSYKGGVIAEGLYKEIKPALTQAGGKYHRSIYIMLEDGRVGNLSLKGAVVREWSDFVEASKNSLDSSWIEVNTAKDEKKGSIKYSVPNFSVGKVLNAKEGVMADDSANLLKPYLEDYFSKGDEVQEYEDADLGI